MSLLVVGSIGFDNIETPAGKVERALGGAAVYFAIAASIFHRPVRIVGVVGKDFPEHIFDRLAPRGIDASCVVRSDGATFTWTGAYAGDMSEAQTRDTQLGVFADFVPPDASVPRSDALFLANIDPEIQSRVLDLAERHGRPRVVGMDSMNYWIVSKRAAFDRILRRVDIYFASEGEARLLTGESLVPAAARRLLDMGPRIVVIKKGPHGSLVATKDIFLQVPPYPLRTITDPTGAGDTYAGAFLGVVADDPEDPLDRALLGNAAATAAVVAAYNCESFSSERLERTTREEVAARISKLRDTVRF